MSQVPAVQSAIRQLLDEADTITRRARPSKADAMRHSAILARVAHLRREGGVDAYNPNSECRDKENRRKLVKFWTDIINGAEIRDAAMESGQATISANGSGGSFVPIQFAYSDLQRALALHSPLFDKDKVTYLETENGGNVQLPVWDDTTVNAEPITEASIADDYTNVSLLGTKTSYTFAYRSTPIAVSMEFDEDAMADYKVSVLETAFAERIARGVGADLMAGNGSAIQGLLTQLAATDAVPVIAAGSSSNDGSGNTGANSLGTGDLINLYHSVSPVYRHNPKAAWLMHDKTWGFLTGLIDKYGSPVMHYPFMTIDGDGRPRILGKPVYVDNSMPQIGASNTTVLFGDLSRWVTRVVPSSLYIQRYNEVAGLVENGLIAFQVFGRYGGTLATTATGGSAIMAIMQHS